MLTILLLLFIPTYKGVIGHLSSTAAGVYTFRWRKGFSFSNCLKFLSVGSTDISSEQLINTPCSLTNFCKFGIHWQLCSLEKSTKPNCTA